MSTLIASEIKEARLSVRGKVRDIYDLGSELLLVATDRISAFDVILPTPIPDKGRVLTGLSDFWFAHTRSIVPNHLLSTDSAAFPKALAAYREMLEGRTMLVKKAKRVDVECVVRGYLAGSGWKEYQKSRTVTGIPLPEGLVEAQKLPAPLFTPTTKEEAGAHDRPLNPQELEDKVGRDLARKLSETSIKVYEAAAKHAESKGLILADTKMEFGFIDGELTLIDELLTPDSSRYWEASSWKPGKAPESFDKQFVRDWLETVGWDKRPPAPELPAKVVEKTREKYRSALKRITG